MDCCHRRESRGRIRESDPGGWSRPRGDPTREFARGRPTGSGQEIKELIIDALALEDVQPADIETEAALFVEGLGLDSIDALELAMALEERHGVKIGDDPERNQQIFASVRNLASFVSENRVN